MTNLSLFAQMLWKAGWITGLGPAALGVIVFEQVLRYPLLHAQMCAAFGRSPDVGTVAEHREKTNGNRVSLPRTGPMRVEIGISRAALRSGCKPRVELRKA